MAGRVTSEKERSQEAGVRSQHLKEERGKSQYDGGGVVGDG